MFCHISGSTWIEPTWCHSSGEKRQGNFIYSFLLRNIWLSDGSFSGFFFRSFLWMDQFLSDCTLPLFQAASCYQETSGALGQAAPSAWRQHVSACGLCNWKAFKWCCGLPLFTHQYYMYMNVIQWTLILSKVERTWHFWQMISYHSELKNLQCDSLNPPKYFHNFDLEDNSRDVKIPDFLAKVEKSNGCNVHWICKSYTATNEQCNAESYSIYDVSQDWLDSSLSVGSGSVLMQKYPQ